MDNSAERGSRDGSVGLMGWTLFVSISSAISGFFLAPAMKQVEARADWIGVIFFSGIAVIGFLRIRRRTLGLTGLEDLRKADSRKNVKSALAAVLSLAVCALVFGLEVGAATVRPYDIYAYSGFGWGIMCFVWMFIAYRNIARLFRAPS
jgi:hypothetical protein